MHTQLIVQLPANPISSTCYLIVGSAMGECSQREGQVARWDGNWWSFDDLAPSYFYDVNGDEEWGVIVTPDHKVRLVNHGILWVAGPATKESMYDPGLCYILSEDILEMGLYRNDIVRCVVDEQGSPASYVKVLTGCMICVEGFVAYRGSRVVGTDARRQIGSTDWYYAPYQPMIESKGLPGSGPKVDKIDEGVNLDVGGLIVFNVAKATILQ